MYEPKRGGGVTPLLLDTYSGASAAYSLRKLRTAYSGYAIRVRRSSDNTTLDVGFKADGTLDTASMLSFVGAGNGFVSIWYDQSSTYNALQVTSANQPQIVSAGALITMNGKPTVKFDGSNDYLVTSSYPFTSTDKVYVAHVSSIATTTASSMVVGHYRQFNPSIFLVGYTSNTRTWVTARNTANTGVAEYAFNTYSINTQYLYETQYDLLNATSILRVKNYRNNSAETMFTNGLASNALPTFSQPISIGSTDNGGHFRLNGNIQEIVLYYNVDQSSNRTGISSNINSYYSIY